MIFDELKNIAQYKNLDERLKLGFDFLLNNDLENLECKKHIIKGDEVYANVQELKTKNLEDKKWEAHRKYIDIQYVIKGKEKIGCGFLRDFSKTTVPYNDEKDVVFLDGENYSYINLKAGDFVVLYPNDVHAPMLKVEENEDIKKVIVKIKL